jgi:biopolymer transport protein ExbD
MRFRRKREGVLEADLTPMIDMTFQLIAFFMLIINFSEVEKSQELELPLSEIVKPPETPPPYKIILNVDAAGLVKFSAFEAVQLNALRPILLAEIGAAARMDVPPGEINVIIRADRNVRTGVVQELMDACKEEGLEQFSLRVNEQLR